MSSVPSHLDSVCPYRFACLLRDGYFGRRVRNPRARDSFHEGLRRTWLRKDLKGSALGCDHKVVSTRRHDEAVTQPLAYAGIEVSGVHACDLSPCLATIG